MKRSRKPGRVVAHVGVGTQGCSVDVDSTETMDALKRELDCARVLELLSMAKAMVENGNTLGALDETSEALVRLAAWGVR